MLRRIICMMFRGGHEYQLWQSLLDEKWVCRKCGHTRVS